MFPIFFTSLQDEVLAISDKVVIRADDLVTWVDTSIVWSWGLQATSSKKNCDPMTSVSLKNSQIDFSDIEQEKGNFHFFFIFHIPLKKNIYRYITYVCIYALILT